MFNDDIKIHEARYANKHQDSIIVLFSNEKDPDLGLQETEIEVNEDYAYYQSLLSKVSIENIVDMTADYKRLGSLEYNTSINNMVTKLATELAQDLYGQQIAQVKKEYELYKLDLHAEKERYVKEITQNLMNEKDQYIKQITQNLIEEKQREKEQYVKQITKNLIEEKDQYVKQITKNLIEERNQELDHHRKRINKELDQHYSTEYVNKQRQLDKEYKARSKTEAEKLAKDMLGITTMQEEKQRLIEEKEKLKKSVKDREEKVIGLDQAVKIKTNKADSVIFDFIIETNYEKEELFKLKLWA